MRFFLLSIAFLFQSTFFAVGQNDSLWAELLQRHVDKTGWVSYSGFRNDSALLNNYLHSISANAPEADWSNDQKLAYWINAYNAFTVKLIIDHYPVRSIKEIKRGVPFVNSVWDIRFIEIGGRQMSLNHIEHDVLRKEFEEPRIHFAIVCASVSCPKLRNEPYRAFDLERQLQEQAIDFVNDPRKNRFEANRILVSPIFDWFKKDFTRKTTLIGFLNMFAQERLGTGTKLEFMEYDWNLNGE
ncbi:MAG: DUF547 domain-containing protein [Bacteroidetes bacterium]|nr:MAG: DUF547 domain-containing protein [Bacteroidota bacterium]